MNWDQKIILCGVGGQGILYMARILYEMGRLQGCEVLGSETHGMSQRGGSVTSHVKIGIYHSPMVRSGTADIVFVLKAEEAYTHLHFLKSNGKLVLNAADTFSLIPTIAQALEEIGVETITKDATGCAMQLGNPLSANLVLLSAGIKSNALPINYDTLEKGVKSMSPPHLLKGNLEAIEAGFTL